MSSTATIRLSGVSKRFGETRALTDCDFEAHSGEVHAIVGENGSGKSTLAKIMSGVLTVDSGTVDILGGTISSPLDARRRGVATIFQEVLVADDASVLDNLFVGSEGLIGRGKDRADFHLKAHDLLDRCVGRQVDLKARVGDLPLGVKQWIVIARAILRQPKVLILDESSAALDLGSTQRLHQEIETLRDRGTTILIVTHRIAELIRIADRATILRDGQAAGVLAKSEITEANLLDLMTQSGRALAAAPISRKRQSSVPLLEAKGLCLTPDAVPFDFTLEPGMVVGLAGLDGQGQERFARLLAGIGTANAGAITCRDASGSVQRITDLASAARLHISWVSGDRKREGIFPQLSIFDNFALGIYRRRLGRFGRLDKPEARRRFAEEVKRLSIKTGPIQNRITSLSGGNQQKVLISRAFADDPRVIVLNDPARGVDLGTKRDLYRELQAFTERGGAVVYLSSEIEEFLGFAHRVDVFVNGSLFRSISGADVNEGAMLGAMFGQPVGAHPDLDRVEEAAR